jgi:hypothetical protein
VYNIEVEGDHCYRVGQQGLLVHNASSLSATALAAEICSLQNRLQVLIDNKKVTGKVDEFKAELSKERDDDRWGAEGELVEYELETAQGRVVNLRGKLAGGDLPGAEIKTRTQPFTSEKNFQNYIKDRIVSADTQLGGIGGSPGELRINLFTFLTILGTPITVSIIEMAIKKALQSKKGVGSGVTNILIRKRSGEVIYSGKPTA